MRESRAHLIASFNSRTREGCDRQMASTRLSHLGFQFTHPGGVRRLPCAQSICFHRVSIHAPGRGATYFGGLLCVSQKVSIHAPGRGATRSLGGGRIWWYQFQFTHPGGVRRRWKSCHTSVMRFQFTHPGGVRLQVRVPQASEAKVSIHAPGRGATAGQSPRAHG